MGVGVDGVVGTVELLYSIFLVYICPWFDSGSGTARMANQYTIRLVANETFSSAFGTARDGEHPHFGDFIEDATGRHVWNQDQRREE
jgi:hypothetical protein